MVFDVRVLLLAFPLEWKIASVGFVSRNYTSLVCCLTSKYNLEVRHAGAPHLVALTSNASLFILSFLKANLLRAETCAALSWSFLLGDALHGCILIVVLFVLTIDKI